MPIRVVQLGSSRAAGEGLRLGTVRRPPRGVKKEDFAKRDYFDLWLPDLAPSAPLFAFAKSAPLTGQHWATYAKRYRAEMRAPAAERLIALLAALSHSTSFSVGCYCGDESHCHRSLLRELLRDAGAAIRE